MCVAKHVTHVQRTAHGGWRGIDCKDVVASGLAVKCVCAQGVPLCNQLAFDVVEGGLIGHGHRALTVLGQATAWPTTAPLGCVRAALI